MKNGIKDIDDILEYLSNDPEKIINDLVQDKDFVYKWLRNFIRNKMLVFSEVRTPAKEKIYPPWINRFMETIRLKCEDCRYFDKKCTDKEMEKKCIEDIYNFLSNQKKRSHTLSTISLDFVQSKILKTINENYLSYVESELTTIKSDLRSVKFDQKKIKERYIDLYNSGNNDSRSKNKIIKDQKRFLMDLPLLELKLYKQTSDFQHLCNQILDCFFLPNLKFEERKIMRPCFSYISIFYQFFWDYLNRKKLRDATQYYDYFKKFDEKPYWSFYLDKTISEVTRNDNIAAIELPEKDPTFAFRYPYLLKHDTLKLDDFFLLSERIKKISMNTILESISYKEFSDDTRTFFDTMIKKGHMLKSIHPFEDKRKFDHEKLKRFFNYQIYLNFLSFIEGTLIEAVSRLKKSFPKKIKRKDLERLIMLFKKHNKLSAKKIINKHKPIPKKKYSTIMTNLKEAITLHPDYSEEDAFNYGDAKLIITNSSKPNNTKWLNDLYNGQV